MISEGLISGFYATGGQEVGIAINGYLFFPYAQAGLVFQDSAGNKWQLTIDTSGSLVVDSFNQ